MVPEYVRWVVFWVALGLAVALTYHDLRKQNLVLEKEPKSVIKLQPRQRRSGDISLLINLKEQMDGKHGAIDDEGIDRDFYDGYDTQDILKRNCTICSEPRNGRRGYGH